MSRGRGDPAPAGWRCRGAVHRALFLCHGAEALWMGGQEGGDKPCPYKVPARNSNAPTPWNWWPPSKASEPKWAGTPKVW